MRFRYASDRSLYVSFGDSINTSTQERVLKFVRLLEAEPIDGIRNLHPSYVSVLVVFDALRLTHSALEDQLAGYLSRSEGIELAEPRTVEIPVCYGGELGPDLGDVAEIHGLSPDQVIDLHSSATYAVYFLGFTPGFAYLGGLDDRLETPRLSSPRLKVPAGSVGIGGKQTAVYPFVTPGGWRLIGRTPTAMFRPDRPGLSLLHMGDRVRFTPITLAQFEEQCR